MAGTHEHLEHAEHAGHHAADPFDKRVAVTMAMIAAVLAGVALFGHRSHNAVLQLKGDANRYLTEASGAEVEKSNLFAWYQAKKARQSSAETSAALAELVAVDDKAARDKRVADWKAKAAEYDAPDPKRHESLKELIERGNEADKKAKDLKAKAAVVGDEAEHAHHQADRLDVAHLLAEVGLVLCSITLLTKQKGWWFAGIVAVVLALATTGSAFLIPHDHPAHADAPHADDKKPGH